MKAFDFIGNCRVVPRVIKFPNCEFMIHNLITFSVQFYLTFFYDRNRLLYRPSYNSAWTWLWNIYEYFAKSLRVVLVHME